jgi:hypothetical protein
VLLLLRLQDVVEDVDLGLEMEVALAHVLQLLRLSLNLPIGRRKRVSKCNSASEWSDISKTLY